MVQEIVEWRLAQYLDRGSNQESEELEDKEQEKSPQTGSKLDLWREYSREEIPRFFGTRFNPGSWNSGLVSRSLTSRMRVC
jgi:hypothetical protein